MDPNSQSNTFFILIYYIGNSYDFKYQSIFICIYSRCNKEEGSEKGDDKQDIIL